MRAWLHRGGVSQLSLSRRGHMTAQSWQGVAPRSSGLAHRKRARPLDITTCSATEGEDRRDQSQPHSGISGTRPSPPSPVPPRTKFESNPASPGYAVRYWLARIRRRLHPLGLATSLLFVLGVILVNWGTESFLSWWLGDGPLGSCLCIAFGALTLTYIKLARVKLAQALLDVFL
mmetsp:Transcript_14333/g.25027  ORF Transcript_14333/g.25027 Transcript_14333/m.25027 type:complete len:175 (+) Transcript_14333:34-558(+)